jgi:hypothetical protein
MKLLDNGRKYEAYRSCVFAHESEDGPGHCPDRCGELKPNGLKAGGNKQTPCQVGVQTDKEKKFGTLPIATSTHTPVRT